MLLVIDVGNTNTSMGIYDGARLRARAAIRCLHLNGLASFRFEPLRKRLAQMGVELAGRVVGYIQKREVRG